MRTALTFRRVLFRPKGILLNVINVDEADMIGSKKHAVILR